MAPARRYTLEWRGYLLPRWGTGMGLGEDCVVVVEQAYVGTRMILEVNPTGERKERNGGITPCLLRHLVADRWGELLPLRRKDERTNGRTAYPCRYPGGLYVYVDTINPAKVKGSSRWPRLGGRMPP